VRRTHAFADDEHSVGRGHARWIVHGVACAAQKPSALGACIGAVVGLVAITPAAGFVTVGHSDGDRPHRAHRVEHRGAL
jgi:Amt family ammonium transporter